MWFWHWFFKERHTNNKWMFWTICMVQLNVETVWRLEMWDYVYAWSKNLNIPSVHRCSSTVSMYISEFIDISNKILFLKILLCILWKSIEISTHILYLLFQMGNFKHWQTHKPFLVCRSLQSCHFGRSLLSWICIVSSIQLWYTSRLL